MRGISFSFSACPERTRGNDLKLRQERFRLDVRKNIFTLWLVRHWKGLSREMFKESPSLEVFKRHLNLALADVV